MLRLERATANDAAAIAALRLAAARDLTTRFGEGTWSFAAETVEGVRLDVLSGNVYIARVGGSLRATLRLSRKNPWIGDTDFFTPCERPLYLTSMAVAPGWQRQGIGRACLVDALRLAAELGAEAIRLDSYDANAGAGNFYLRCGFRCVRREEYNGTPLIWFERVVPEVDRTGTIDGSGSSLIDAELR